VLREKIEQYKSNYRKEGLPALVWGVWVLRMIIGNVFNKVAK